MKNSLFPTAFLAIYLTIPSSASAAELTRIYAFGDSITDNGNVDEIVFNTLGVHFPPPPYFDGRFSNGRIWVEYLAERVGVELVDLAFGGATTGSQNTLDATFPIPLPGVQQQIGNFALANPMADPNALYTILAGANDYLPTNSIGFMPYDTPTIPLSNIAMAIATLAGVGAKNIMIVNLPDLGKIPLFNSTLDGVCPPGSQFDPDCLNALTAAHNAGLASLIASPSPNVNLIPVDLNKLVNNVIDNPARFGFTNVTNACLNTTTFMLCSNPNEYLFWDERHPTTKAHALIGNLAFRALGVPEPSAIAGILAVGLLAVSAAFRKL